MRLDHLTYVRGNLSRKLHRPFVPIQISTAGKIVFAPAWNPPEYEEIDPLKAKIFTPEVVKKMRTDSPIPLSEGFFRNTVTKSANYFNSWQSLWWAAVD